MPQLDASRRCAARHFGGRRSIDLCDERPLVFGEEAFNARKRRHESSGEVRRRGRANNNQQADAMPHDGIAFVRLVANAMIVGYRNPASLAHHLEPYRIRRVRREVIRVSLDGQAA